MIIKKLILNLIILFGTIFFLQLNFSNTATGQSIEVKEPIRLSLVLTCGKYKLVDAKERAGNPVLEITGVSEEIVINDKVVPNAYRFGVVEKGKLSMILGKEQDGSLDMGYAFSYGYQDINFNLPENRAVKTGYETDNIFVSKGKLVGDKLIIERGFKVLQLPNGEIRKEIFNGKSINITCEEGKKK